MKMEYKCKRNIVFFCIWRQILVKRIVYFVVVVEGVVFLISWVGVCLSQCEVEVKLLGERN